MHRPHLTIQLFLLIFTLVSITGCSQVVHVSHSDIKEFDRVDDNIDDIRTKVIIQPQALGNQTVHSQSGLFIVGIANKWDVDLNKNLPTAMQSVMAHTYPDVRVGNSCPDCGLFVRPSIKNVKLDKISMRSTLDLEVRFFDAHGQIIKTLKAHGDSSHWDGERISAGIVGYFVPLLGTALGPRLVRETVKDALNEALSDMSEQISQETNSGVLARHWKAKGANQGKAIGNHQYNAEKLAINNGCDMNSDEVMLTQTKYAQETYSVQCWGKPAFMVLCEFGQCVLEDDQDSIAQAQNRL